MRYLLDTNVLSEPVKLRPDPLVMERLLRHRHDVSTAAPAWHELCFGVDRLPPSKRRDYLNDYLEGLVSSYLPVLPYDAKAAEWHAEQRARLQGIGKPPPFIDGQIAAVAKVNDLVLVTRDATGFASFEGLQIESWFES